MRRLCLLKMPYVLRRLMFEFFLDTLRADDFRPGLAGWIVRKLASIARRTAARINRVAARASGAESVATVSVAVGDGRSVSLGVAVSFVARVASRARYRQTGNRHRLASSGLPPVLDVEKSPTDRTTKRCRQRYAD
jgi:hypothetical protein